MSNVIDFLEMIGQDARLRHAPCDEMKLTLASMQIDPDLRVAALAKDKRQLEALIVTGNVYCMQFPGIVSCMQFAGMDDEDEIHRERCA